VTAADRPGEVSLGVVIPTLDEVSHLPRLLDDLRSIHMPIEIVVADGGSTDGTLELAAGAGAHTVSVPPGRATQMNAGARSLAAPWLLFLHADSRLPPATLRALEGWLRSPPPSEAAHFAFRLDAKGSWWRFIERVQRVREKWTGLAYGDQGLLLSRRRYEAIGGIPALPLMEDVEVVRVLRGSGGIDRIDAPVLTSARRYREEGPIFGWIRNGLLLTLHLLRFPPARLARWYRPTGSGARDGGKVTCGAPLTEEATPAEVAKTTAEATRAEVARPLAAPRPAERILLIFAKAPDPGRVKTRLAASLGAEEAAAIYRSMGSRVVDTLRNGPWRTILYFDPPEAEDRIRDWLGTDGLEFLAQPPGGLGERLSDGFDWGFGEGAVVCAVGTDAPALTVEVVTSAFIQLEGPGDSDLVLGPANDGGYYLIALRRRAPKLFDGIPWSTGQVLEATLDAALALELCSELLVPLTDVDRPEDVPEEFRSRASL